VGQDAVSHIVPSDHFHEGDLSCVRQSHDKGGIGLALPIKDVGLNLDDLFRKQRNALKLAESTIRGRPEVANVGTMPSPFRLPGQ